MPHPLIIGGLIVGGAYAAWRLVSERSRMRRLMRRLVRETGDPDDRPAVPLERDPDSGVFRPRREP